MAKIYTKGGDQGQTSIIGGKRLSKDHVRIEAYGTVDELNAQLGLVADQLSGELQQTIRLVQEQLFTIGAILAAEPQQKMPGMELKAAWVERIEALIDEMQRTLPELKQFILPGGHPLVSHCHIARCVCRRAERRIVALSHETEVDPILFQYLNRLSDFLFVLARKVGQGLGVNEIPWQSAKS